MQQHHACCEAVLQSSTEQWGLQFALSTAAVQFCWVSAHLNEMHFTIGAIAVKHCLLACCSVVLCKTGSQQPCATAVTPMKICSSHMCAVMQHQCTAALVKAEQLACCSVLLCKTGLQQPCATAVTPMKICSSYMSAVMQHKCTAALVKAEQLPCCSVLLCKTGSQQDCATAVTPMKICS